MNFTVLHIESRQIITGGLDRHITRVQWDSTFTKKEVWVPDNADPERTPGNAELVSRQGVDERGRKITLTLQQAVDRRLKMAGVKPRKTQATSLEIIFSGSPERFAEMSPEEIQSWAKDTVSWSQKTWGKDNVVSAILHVDEKTPHIHMIVVPIVTGQSRRTLNEKQRKKRKKSYSIDNTKLRLCANEIFTSGKLYAYHDSYAKEVGSTYGFERGVRAEPGSKKKHQNSEDYNRTLAKQVEEKKSLIAELTSYHKTINEDIRQLEEKNIKAEERLSELEGKVKRNRGVIDRQVADFNARKEELTQTKTNIAANKETLAQQKQTISDNEATIQKQQKLKSSTIISDDAAEMKIQEKLQELKSLEEEEHRLERAIVSKKTDLATADANLKKRLRQIDAKVNLDDVPKKRGILGYNSDEVDAFIESVDMASLKRAMSWTPTDVKVDSAILEENARLRKMEDDFMDFRNSPERMRQRMEQLENESKRHKIEEVLKYVVQRAVNVINFTEDKATEEIFTKFTIGQSSKEYAAHITPKGSVYYTDKSIKNLQEAKARRREKIWWGGHLDNIRAKREKEDVLSRYSTKLSLLTKEDIKVADFVADGNHILLFASNRRAYEVKPDGSTRSTGDPRVRTLDDCHRLSQAMIWKNEGDINNPKINRGIHR